MNSRMAINSKILDMFECMLKVMYVPHRIELKIPKTLSEHSAILWNETLQTYKTIRIFYQNAVNKLLLLRQNLQSCGKAILYNLHKKQVSVSNYEKIQFFQNSNNNQRI